MEYFYLLMVFIFIFIAAVLFKIYFACANKETQVTEPTYILVEYEPYIKKYRNYRYVCEGTGKVEYKLFESKKDAIKFKKEHIKNKDIFDDGIKFKAFLINKSQIVILDE